MKIAPYETDEAPFEATRQDGVRRVRIHRPGTVQVVLGRGGRPDAELHLDACLADGVPVLRRRGGGGAVVLDPGNLVVTVTEHAPGISGNRAHFDRLSRWLIDCLERAGVVGLRQAGISDLVRGDRKVAGACLHRSRDTLLYTVSLLVEPDVGLIERYLRHPPREPDYRRARAHADFVGTLAPDLWSENAESLRRRLVEGCAAAADWS